MCHLAGVRDQTGVGREHTRHIGVELACVGFEPVGKCNCGGVAATTTKKRDFLVGRHSLRASHDRHRAGGQRFLDSVGHDLFDAGVLVGGVGDDARLATGK